MKMTLCTILGILCGLLLGACHSSTHALLARAQDGEAAAQFEYGRRLLTGQKTAPDRSLAPGWFYAAASQGHAKAQAALGTCYQRGLGLPRNEKEALKWYNKAAIQGEQHATRAVLEYADTKKGKKAVKNALRPLLAAENPAAELYLAVRLLQEVPANKTNQQQAVDYLRYAAMGGSGEAAFLLFLCYLEGTGVYPSTELGIGWLITAANMDYEPAIALLQQLQAELNAAGIPH